MDDNTNGLVRQYFPKGTGFAKLTDTYVQRVEDLLNNRRRKTLNYHSPNEVSLISQPRLKIMRLVWELRI